MSGVFKLYCAVGNNAAWMACLDAHDRIKQHRNYRHRVKQLFQRTLEDFHAYERTLLHSSRNRMFHVADLEPAARKKYGDISDREYYDMWVGVGCTVYQKTRPLITSLWNKYRLSLIAHGIAQPDIVAWAITGQACLELACTIFESATDVACNQHGVPHSVSNEVFGAFNLRKVADAWRMARIALDPVADSYEVEGMEKRNIDLGMDQLQDAWMNPRIVNGSTAETITDYEDIFRTKGEMKKVLKYIAEVDQNAKEQEEEERIKRIYEQRTITLPTADAGGTGSQDG